MSRSPRLQSPAAWEATVIKAADDYRSGLALIQLGAFGLLDPALAGMLLAIRRGLIEETNAASTEELVLIDIAVVAYANAMRLQSMIGNTALIIESEMFGQPTLRAKWKSPYGARPEDIQGLAVEEHVSRLRDQLLPLAERTHRTARESIEAISRLRQIRGSAPSLAELPRTLETGRARHRPIASFLVPGNTADVTLLLPVVKRLRQPFGIVHACIVADRGMISTDSIAALEAENIAYILGVRERIISASRTETARSEYVGLAGQ